MTGWRTRSRLAAGVVLLALGAAQPASAQGQANAVLVASGLSEPLYATAPDGDARIFAVERAGRIRVVKNGATLATPFLEISSRVTTTSEGGLLGLAFPPDYATSGLFYVYYTDLADDSVVSRFSVTGNPDVADADSEDVVLLMDQPAGRGNHKGGTIHFGPDGFLWFATGDGGGSNDPDELAQNPQSLLGKMLRIDPGPDFAPNSIEVPPPPPPAPAVIYRIPFDNPFVGDASPRDEIWALGFRNPYRWSFDRATGDVWIGDVGQGALEEVDFENATDPGGRNYGWDVMEGPSCNGSDPAPSPPCDDPSLTLPIHEYDHNAGDCSIIGGFVYQGDSSALRGLYFFGDFCTGGVWSLNPANLGVVDRTAELGAAAGVGFTLVGFGEDGFGRLLLVQRTAGTVYRIGPSTPPPLGCGIGPELVAALLALTGLRRARRRLAGPGAFASL
jgi:glucose/arabinose dehydrogenase